MKKLISLLALGLALSFQAAAVTPRILSMERDPMHILTVDKQRESTDGVSKCAMIKVQLPVENVRFEGDIVGDVEYHISEYWVWVWKESRRLQIMCPGHHPLMVEFGDWLGSERLAENGVYKLVVQPDMASLPGQRADTVVTEKVVYMQKPKAEDVYYPTWALCPMLKKFNMRVYSGFDSRSYIGGYIGGNLSYFQFGFEFNISKGVDKLATQYIEKDNLKGYYFQSETNSGTAGWENSYLRPKFNLMFRPGINLRYFSIECGVGDYFVEKSILGISYLNSETDFFKNNIEVKESSSKQYFVLSPGITGYIPFSTSEPFAGVSVSVNYNIVIGASALNGLTFGLGLFF